MAEHYTHEELLANARRLTGHPRRVLAGALHGEEKDKLTANQAKQKGNSYLKRAEGTNPTAADKEKSK